MKRNILTILLVAQTLIAFGQTVTFGVKGGLNFAQIMNSSPQTDIVSSYPGINAGIVSDIDFKKFVIEPGLFYSAYKSKDQYIFLSSSTPIIDYSISANYYLVLPVNFIYKVEVAPHTYLRLGGGPYLGYGLSTTGYQYNNGAISNYTYNYSFRNPDFGINLLAGVRIHKFIIDAGYTLGIANLVYNVPGQSYVTVQNRAISFSVGYFLK
jgi:hypothetical protein